MQLAHPRYEERGEVCRMWSAGDRVIRSSGRISVCSSPRATSVRWSGSVRFRCCLLLRPIPVPRNLLGKMPVAQLMRC